MRDKIRDYRYGCLLFDTLQKTHGFIFDIDGNNLNCDLSVDSRMSFIAVSNLEMFNWIYNFYKQNN